MEFNNERIKYNIEKLKNRCEYLQNKIDVLNNLINANNDIPLEVKEVLISAVANNENELHRNNIALNKLVMQYINQTNK